MYCCLDNILELELWLFYSLLEKSSGGFALFTKKAQSDIKALFQNSWAL